MSAPRISRRRLRDGFVLMCVMWVMAMLIVLTLGFGHRVVLERRSAAYSLDVVRAKMYARGAVYRGMLELRNKRIKEIIRGESGVTHHGQPWAKRLDLFKEGDFYDVPESYANDSCVVEITDAQARIDINSAARELLDEVDPLSSSALRRIISRRTEGVHEGEPRAVFFALEELRYLRGVRDDDWFGEDGNPGLKDLLTVYGNYGVNLNTATRDVLLTLPDVGDSEVDRLINWRAGPDRELFTGDDRGAETRDMLAEVSGASGDVLDLMMQYGTLSSSTFTVRGVCTLRQGRIRATATAVVKLNMMRGEMFIPRVVSWKEEALGA